MAATRLLKIALSPGAENLEKVKSELIAKGHEVLVVPELDSFDVVLGKNCHRLWEANESLLTVLIKAVRIRVYGARGNVRK